MVCTCFMANRNRTGCA